MNAVGNNTPKRGRQQERLILALLEQPTFEKAAAAADISISTAYRIRKTLEFEAAYRHARGQAVSDAWARLQQASGAAATTMLKIMVDPSTSAADRLRAANRVLVHAKNAIDTDLVERVERLEAVSVELARAIPKSKL